MRFSIKNCTVKAFSLLEISFVLMIMGIFVFGGLKGWELVQKAKLYRVVTEIEMYSNAVLAFREEYGDYPGSCDHKVFSQKGNGSGNLSGDRPVGSSEFSFAQITSLFWLHLKQSNLISIPHDNIPRTPFGGVYSVCSYDNQNYLVLANKVRNGSVGGLFSMQQAMIINDKCSEEILVKNDQEQSPNTFVNLNNDHSRRDTSSSFIIYVKI